MIRRDNPQDAEKARNYSTFWIEVAMGREPGDGSAAALADEAGTLDDLIDPTDPTDMADGANGAAGADVPNPSDFIAPVKETKPAKSKATEKKQDAPKSLSSLADLANIDMLMKNSADMGEDNEVNLATDEAEDLDVPLTTDFNFDETDEGAEAGAEAEGEEAEADEFEDFGEDFDEEDDNGWGGGRKSKPSKPQKQRREQRRPF
jgi:hypothetical protein